MKVFLINGVDSKELLRLLDNLVTHIDGVAMLSANNDVPIEFECFDTLTNTRIYGAQALAELIAERKKVLGLLQE